MPGPASRKLGYGNYLDSCLVGTRPLTSVRQPGTPFFIPWVQRLKHLADTVLLLLEIYLCVSALFLWIKTKRGNILSGNKNFLVSQLVKNLWTWAEAVKTIPAVLTRIVRGKGLPLLLAIKTPVPELSQLHSNCLNHLLYVLHFQFF